MCLYTVVSPACGHSNIYSSANCYLIYEQLRRISDPVFHLPGNNNFIPFDMDDVCLPSRYNVRIVRTEHCGGVECANEMLGEATVATSDYTTDHAGDHAGGWRRGHLEGLAGTNRRRDRGLRSGLRPRRVIGAEGARGGKRLGVGWRS